LRTGNQVTPVSENDCLEGARLSIVIVLLGEVLNSASTKSGRSTKALSVRFFMMSSLCSPAVIVDRYMYDCLIAAAALIQLQATILSL